MILIIRENAIFNLMENQFFISAGFFVVTA